MKDTLQNMINILDLKTENDDFQVEYEVLSLDPRINKINSELIDIDEKIQNNQEKLNKIDNSIDKLTNDSDGLDYAIAVTSGMITGIIDATIVGEWNFKSAKDKVNEDINDKVVQFAKKDPRYIPWCEGEGRTARWIPRRPDSSTSAIEFLEEKYHLPGDGAYKMDMSHFGITPNTHRLDDLCHHPTIVGLVCCVIVQFTGSTLYVNKFGEDINIPVTVNEYGNFVGKNPVTKMFAGVINWFIICAKTMANRQGHLMSDIATSASLPGGFLSTITELASIPCFRDEDFLKKLRNAYVNGIGNGNNKVDLGAFNVLFEGASSKFDIKTETAIKNELKRQSMPVIINEVLVRGAYFIRHLIKELHEKNDIALVEWNKIIPFNNRTIARMMTIASGTFTTVDLADAAVRSTVKSGGFGPAFLENMILRVNFVGVGRLAVAVTTDAGMGIVREVKRTQRIKVYEEQIALTDAKVFYKQADTWIAAENTGKAIMAAYKQIDSTTSLFVESMHEMSESLEKIGSYVPKIEKKNSGLIDEISDILKWE